MLGYELEETDHGRNSRSRQKSRLRGAEGGRDRETEREKRKGVMERKRGKD